MMGSLEAACDEIYMHTTKYFYKNDVYNNVVKKRI